MKNTSIVTLLVLLISFSVYGQQKETQPSVISLPLIGDTAPAFRAQSTMGTINFPSDYFGKWKILFSHPADFTAVCSSEIIGLATMQEDFKKLNTQIVVLSTDGINSHISWVKALESINADNIPNFKINFPLISDQGLEISKKYGMIRPNSTDTKDIRAVFIIDTEDKIRAIFYYPANVGRNLQEIQRTLVALQTSEKHHVLIPVNWNPGDKVMIQSPKDVQEADKLAASKNRFLSSPIWFMWYKDLGI